jgi:MoaA/NifB/PqqE/SkfB family radical SAM enzyme
MISKTFCVLPWIHFSTRPNGHIRVCCTANASGAGPSNLDMLGGEIGIVRRTDGSPANLGNESLFEAWNSDYMKSVRVRMLKGEIPLSCLKCFKEEAATFKSKRLWETGYWSKILDIDEIVKNTREDGYVDPKLYYLDIRLGTKCNLKCVMCSPWDSSAWESEWRRLYPYLKNEEIREVFYWDGSGETDGGSYEWYKNDKFWEELYTQIPHIKQLYFAGGESLIIDEYNTLLREIIKMRKAKDIFLRYNSNGITLRDEHLDLWKHFKKVRFLFSIDSIGEMNRYIRYPSTWKLVKDTLRKLDNTGDNIEVLFACAVQSLNVYYIPDIIKWKLEQNYKKINPWPFGGGLINTHLVYHPPFFNIKCLPKEFKDKVAEKYERFYKWIVKNYRSDNTFLDEPWGIKRLDSILKFMYSEDWSIRMCQFREFINALDKVRGTDFRRTFPEMGELLDE